VEAALEAVDIGHIPEEINNELTVSLSPPVADMTDADLAELPRGTLDSLFRDGDLDRDRYARVVELKLKPGDSDDVDE
jgi:hypothetical protein